MMFKQKVFLILNMLLLSIFSMNAQQKNKDYSVQKRLIVIYKMTPEVVEGINSLKRKEYRAIYLISTISQVDFDWACRAFPWIRRLGLWTTAGEKQINNIEAIVHLDSLKVLSLTHLRKTKETPLDLEPLTNLTAIEELNFQGTHVKSTEPLGQLKQLQKINFDHSDIASISFLCSTPKVKELILIGPRHTFENYGPVTCLKELEVLNVYHNKQATDENLDTLKVLTNLREIRMPYNKQITTLDFLQNNLNLEYIGCNKCRNLQDFSAVARFKKLKHFNVSRSRLRNLDMLEGLTKLEGVYVTATRIKDISILADCLDLKSLDIAYNPIKDITPLYNCRELVTLKITPHFRDRPFGAYNPLDSLKKLNPDIRIKEE